MKRAQLLLAALAIGILALVLTQPVKATIASQQQQIGMLIIVVVSPNPLGYVPHQAPAGNAAPAVVSSLSRHRVTPSLARGFQAEGLHFEQGSSTLVAQAQVQHSVLMQAEVTPNPKATILYTQEPLGTPANSVTLNATAGTTTQYPCAFYVIVDMNTTWSLEEGLASEMTASSGGSTFPGKDVANNTYISSATPKPTSTPYVVYPDDGKSWSLLGSGTSMTTYCVTLTITVPAETPATTYSDNAIYTLFN
ncbi:MAG: hypothetical protein WA629_14890 [Candidatus Aquilonibacter sp.]